ncbi:hypothetical protein [Streptomyces sp. NPDC002889]|uniref:hypothetical protein n=1 Tax=Streptomyces sp. NPDC002889 TaxID=3364669 RepID=UPI003674ABE5
MPRTPGIGLAAVRTSSVSAGFLFALTLHVQSGLGHSVPRAGTMSAPAPVVFGAVRSTPCYRSACPQKALVQGGFVLIALAGAAGGRGAAGPLHGRPAPYTAFLGVGDGPALAHGPTVDGRTRYVLQRAATDALWVTLLASAAGGVVGAADCAVRVVADLLRKRR